MSGSHSASELEILENFFDWSVDLLCIVSTDGYLQRVNSAFTQVLGYGAETLLTQPFLSFIHPDDCDRVQAEMERLLSPISQPTLTFYHRWLHQDGSSRYLEWNLKRVQDAGETLFYGAARDVTARHEAEAEAQAQHAETDSQLEAQIQDLNQDFERYAHLIQHVPLAMNIWQLKDPNDARSLTLLDANLASAQSIGIDATALVGKTILECFPTLSVSELERHAQVARRNIPSQHYQVPYEDEQISGVYDLRLFALPQDCVASIFEDISKRVHLARRLHHSESLFRTMFERAPIGVARMSAAGQWLELNSKLCEILGYSAAELQTKTFADITHPEDHQHDEYYYDQFISGKIDTCVFEKRYLHAEGHPIWSNVSVSALRQEDRALDGFIVTVQDIDHRKQIEADSEQRSHELRSLNQRLAHTARALEQRNDELQQFAYVVSHDLKAPLRAIASLSDWLEEDLDGELPSESQRHLQLIRKRVERMGSLLDGLLNYSRVGRKHVEVESIAVQEMLQAVIDSLAPPEGFQIEIVGTMPDLEARRFSLSQVFSNLINNAIKYCDRPDGKLRITAQAHDEHYEFSLQDNGPGIDPKHHQKIFTIFQTLQARDKVESTGVGLAIVKKILDTEGGKIWVHSEPGQGATFSFTWPQKSVVLENDQDS